MGITLSGFYKFYELGMLKPFHLILFKEAMIHLIINSLTKFEDCRYIFNLKNYENMS